MTRHKSWTLTDVASDVWLDSFAVSNDSMRLATPHDWSIRKHTLRGGLRDGVDLVEVHNGALSYSILPSRGMGLWRGEYRGNYLGWRGPVHGPVHPKFVQLDDRGGLGWLNGFDELLCRCGLASNGPPGEDEVTDKSGRTSRTKLTLHGRIANQPAQFVEVRVNLDPPHELSISGEVEEGCLFFPHLRLTTTCTTVPGSNRLVVHDVVENRGGQPAEMQILYHCNIGPPFLESGSRIMAPIRELSPLTPRAAEGMETFSAYPGPTAGFAEQVYCYEPMADAVGKTMAMLYNAAADRGLVMRWNRNDLPCFTVWKNCGAAEDGYVTGLEPGTNYPNFKSFERDKGRVRLLPPGGKWEATFALEIYDSAAAVAKVLAEIVSLQAHTRPVLHVTPQARFSALGS
jgi:hypothetical protein